MRRISLASNERLTYVFKSYKDDVDAYEIDASALADDFGNVTSSTAEIKNGSNIVVTTPVVSSNKITFNVTLNDFENAAFVIAINFTNGAKRNVTIQIKGAEWFVNYVSYNNTDYHL